jgi:hypothetical protein
VLIAYGALSTLFNTITFLFAPGENNVVVNGETVSTAPSFSDRAHLEVGSLLSVDVIAALVGAVMLAHLATHVKNAKIIALISLVALGVADLFGLVALFSAFGANGATGWDKTSTFFISLGQLAIAGLGTYLVLAYFQQHAPAAPAQAFNQQAPANQWGQPQQQDADSMMTQAIPTVPPAQQQPQQPEGGLGIGNWTSE